MMRRLTKNTLAFNPSQPKVPSVHWHKKRQRYKETRQIIKENQNIKTTSKEYFSQS